MEIGFGRTVEVFHDGMRLEQGVPIYAFRYRVKLGDYTSWDKRCDEAGEMWTHVRPNAEAADANIVAILITDDRLQPRLGWPPYWNSQTELLARYDRDPSGEWIRVDESGDE